MYEDDDYINFFGNGTDDAYTNGSRLDYFYKPEQRPHGLLGRWAPRAGDSSIDIYGWGVMQLMYTPNNIDRPEWQPHDYQYAGALIAIHSRYSYNPVKKYAFQTELVMGIIGPSALAQKTQSGFHRLIHYTQPRGWGHQYRNDALLNVNFTAEKQLVASAWFTLIEGAQVRAGTMENSAALYPLLLIGRMNPYFNGLFSQYAGTEKRKWLGYFLFKPALQYSLQNSMLEGGLFTHNPNKTDVKDKEVPPALQPWVPSCTYGVVIAHGNFGFSITENISSSALRRLYCHDVGNISLYFSW